MINVKTASISALWAFLAAATKPCEYCKDGWVKVGESPLGTGMISEKACEICDNGRRLDPLLPELRDYTVHYECAKGQLCIHTGEGNCEGLGYLVVQDINILATSMKKAGIQPMDIEAVRDDFVEAFLAGRDLYGVIVRAAVQAVQAMEAI